MNDPSRPPMTTEQVIAFLALCWSCGKKRDSPVPDSPTGAHYVYCPKCRKNSVKTAYGTDVAKPMAHLKG